MEILSFLIPLAILIAAFFIAGFIWMTLQGQYDDLETPAMRMLISEELSQKNNNKNKNITLTNKEDT